MKDSRWFNGSGVNPAWETRDTSTLCTKAKIEQGKIKKKIEEHNEDLQLEKRWWSGLYKDDE